MKLKILSLLLLFSGLLSAQATVMQGTIDGLNNGKITLSDFYGNEDKVVDSISRMKQGVLIMLFPMISQPGCTGCVLAISSLWTSFLTMKT